MTAVDAPDAFRVERHASGEISLAGVMDESADLSFFAGLAGHVRINMRRVRRINSYGVRAWIDAVRSVPQETVVELVECPPSVVDQINMVAGFLGHGRVASFYAPMACERCGHEKEQLFGVAEFRAAGRLPEVKCPQCGEVMQVDDLEEHYLLFARE